MQPRVLIVNDEADLLEACSLILQSAGYTVETLLEGPKTADQVARFAPDVVLLDWVLGKTKGEHVLRELRGRFGSSFSIVVMSALPDLRRRALDLGADDFLQKPFDDERLLSIVDAHVKRRHTA
jgi:two-component system cell cycle response regulator DivK